MGQLVEHRWLKISQAGRLINPKTNELLELDRYYPPKVSFDYNGLQHYETTDWYPDAKELADQKTRDLLKQSVCTHRKVQLVIVRRGDLILERMRRKVEGTGLPLRDLHGHEALVELLEQEAKAT